ncbi:O-antigen ligase family protein [Streptomyces sp. NPDC048604]|uniref:O-antigen ligase family protein n=1 Tax=Streptomyces sp. NPDC048604 TaxID=3365578 RepID=UPI003711A07D
MTARMAERPVVRERGHASDVAGVLVLGACVLWSLISAAGREARPEGVVLAVLAVAAGYAVGRIVGSLLPVAAATAAALGLAAFVLFPGDGAPGAVDATAPLGRAGATTALLVLAAGAACCAAAAAGPGPLRQALRALAVVIAATAAVLGSVVGVIASLGVLLCSLAAVRMRRRVLALAGLALAAGLVAGGSWAVAEDALPDGPAASAQGLLTAHRVGLWRDAAGMAHADPVRGAGPDRFGELSPTAQQTLYADGKPHSAVLQQAAEQGVPGVVLLGAAYGWLLCGLASSPRSTPVVLTAAATLTALAILASVGNALSFTPVTAAAGLLAGLATAGALPAPDGTDATDATEAATPPPWESTGAGGRG